MEKNKLYKLIIMNLKKHGAKKIAIFGSYARNEERKKSDIDILVEFKNTKSLLELVGLEMELSEITGKKIDLLTKKSISPLIFEHIKKDILTLYK